MTHRSIPVFALLVASLALTGPLCASTPPMKDTRKVISMPPRDVDLMKAHMRASLGLLQTLLEKSAARDWKAVKTAAAPLTTKNLPQSMKAFSGPPPKEFIAMATPMHILFDEIVRDADKIKDPAHTTKQVARVMGTCTGCHTHYKFP